MNKIKIGYKTYDIVYDNNGLHNDGLYGQIDYHNNKIRLRDDYDKVDQLNTILHEVLHGVFYQIGDRKLRKDEDLINCIANGLTHVIVDNNIEIIFQKSKPEIDKHEDWIGKRVNCWDNDKSKNQTMIYLGFDEAASKDDKFVYRCKSDFGLKLFCKNIELVDDENA